MRKGLCIHFTGLLKDVCDKGVNYKKVTLGGNFGMITRIPCLKQNNRPCKHFYEPTEEEILEYEKKQNASIKGLSEAIELIKIDSKEHGGKLNGFINCPVCGSPLNYSISDYNGHIWGSCCTPNCLSWMM